jgi:nucleotide-binding universal stress UspA family protein
MFTHILFPLDGSATAEAVLPLGAAIAARHGSEVTLLHLVERGAPSAVHGDRHLSEAASAEAYLDRIRERFFPVGMTVHRHVHSESHELVPDGIVHHAAELHADLVVMCTHGRGGIRHRLFGNIAERVVHARVAPVLLVPPEAGETPFPFRRLLVPLDGNAAHEVALDIAASLAALYDASVMLLMVVPTLGTLPVERRAGTFLPGSMSELLDLEQENAIEYVGEKMDWIENQNVRVEARVARGDAAGLIAETTAHAGADLVVAASHGTAGFDAFWSGSVTPRVSARSRVPLLLVPAPPVG